MAGKKNSLSLDKWTSNQRFNISIHRSFGSSVTQNCLFEGDNLVLLSYMEASGQCVDLIYIDPPYNTGSSDMSFSDSFARGRSLARKSWTDFMRPRLVLAHKILAADGVLFVSIDDREMANAVVLLDSIFGSASRVATFVKPTAGAKNDSKFCSRRHEYLILYAKTPSAVRWLQKKSVSSETKNSLKLQQLNKWGSNDRKSDRPNLHYPIYVRKDLLKISVVYREGWHKVLPLRADGSPGCWRWGKEKVHATAQKLIAKMSTSGKIKIYTVGLQDNGFYPWQSILSDQSDAGGIDIKQLFGDAKIFTYAKSLGYMKWILSLYTKPNAIVFDFFAGSGTTGHAALVQNDLDGRKRIFILCQIKEENGKNIFKLSLSRLASVVSQLPRGEESKKEPINTGFSHLSIKTNPDSSSSRDKDSHLFVVKRAG